MLQRDLNFKNKIHFTSLGCARNLVDTEVMMGILLQGGYEWVSTAGEADFLVVNTCGFLEASRAEGMEVIRTLFQEKKGEAKVIVAGCMVNQGKEALQKAFPEIHYFLGSGDVEQILSAVQSAEPGVFLSKARSFLEWGEVPRVLSTPRHYAYLKIAEGCRKRCSYCIIPAIKGSLKSKTVERVVQEFRALLARGVFEVVLIAQDLGDFGKDRGERGALAGLLRALLCVEGDFWLRLLYIYPDEIDAELVALMKRDRRLCPYLDMPIQHINDSLLKAMHRTTSRREIESTIAMLKQEIPSISIRTSLMVGFPGETEEQFQELVEFVGHGWLDQVGIFPFSREKEAFADRLPGHVAEEVKRERVERLAEAQQRALAESAQRWINCRLEVLIEGFHPESNLLLRGRHAGQCPDIDGEVIINGGLDKVSSFGELYEVQIDRIAGYDLVGQVQNRLKRTVGCPKRNRLSLLSS